jgi:PAS domain S-box-containing protein
LIDENLMSSRFPWWEWDVVADRVTASPLKVTILGYRVSDFEGAGYERYMDLVHPEDQQRTMQAMREHLEGRAAVYQVDYRIRSAAGSYTWYMDRGVAVSRGKDGRPLLLRGIVLDLGPALHARVHEQALVAAIRGALPADETAVLRLCSSCMRMRYGGNEWIEVPSGLAEGFPAQVSHGLCSDCIRKLYPEFADGVIASLE